MADLANHEAGNRADAGAHECCTRTARSTLSVGSTAKSHRWPHIATNRMSGGCSAK